MLEMSYQIMANNIIVKPLKHLLPLLFSVANMQEKDPRRGSQIFSNIPNHRQFDA